MNDEGYLGEETKFGNEFGEVEKWNGTTTYPSQCLDWFSKLSNYGSY